MPSQFTDSISAIMLHCNRRKPGQCLDNFSNFTLKMFVQFAQCLKITKNISKIRKLKGILHFQLHILIFGVFSAKIQMLTWNKTFWVIFKHCAMCGKLTIYLSFSDLEPLENLSSKNKTLSIHELLYLTSITYTKSANLDQK